MSIYWRGLLLLIAGIVGFIELDYGFVLLAILFSIWTPSRSPYRSINIVLACEFIFTLGVIEWTIYQEIPQESVLIYAVKMGKDYIFTLVFLYLHGRHLSMISALMGFYHLALVATIMNGGQVPDNAYLSIMTVFCIAQLICGWIGLVHGTANRVIPARFARRINYSRTKK